MPLTDTAIRKLRLRDDGKPIAKSDGGGLILLVKKSGKYWRLRYRFNGKQKELALGVYGDVTLAEARLLRETLKAKVRQGIDPAMERRVLRMQQHIQASGNTFANVAEEMLQRKRQALSADTLKDAEARLHKHAMPWLGNMLLADITATDVLHVVRRIEQRGAIETAHKIKGLCSQVFRYGVATGRISSDPTRDLRGAMMTKKVVHRAAIKTPQQAGELMRAIDDFTGTLVVQCALQLSPLVFLRPGELRQLEWAWFLDGAMEFRLPDSVMKMGEAHIVPLSRQALDIINTIKPYSSAGRYIFPSIRTFDRPMSENTINAALRRLGYAKEDMCAHGFRGMASTLLHEMGYKTDWIERQLAHKEGNEIKAAYNHARHLKERTLMMQAWSDYLYALRDGAEIVSFNRA